MGFVIVQVKVLPANGQRPVEVEALVDTGAIYSLLPRSILESVGVEPTDEGSFRTIEGKRIRRDVGNVVVEVNGKRSRGAVPVIFGGPKDKTVLGVTALEMMGLQVDPVGRELHSTDMLLLSVRQR